MARLFTKLIPLNVEFNCCFVLEEPAFYRSLMEPSEKHRAENNPQWLLSQQKLFFGGRFYCKFIGK